MIKRISAFCMAIMLVFGALPTVALTTESNAVCTVEFYDASTDAKIDSIGSQQKIYAKVKFTAPSDGDADIVVAKYFADGSLDNAVIEPAENLSAGTEVEYTTSAVDISGTDHVKVFVWDGKNNLKPIASNYGFIEREKNLNASASVNVSSNEGETAAAVSITAGKATADIKQGTKLQSGATTITLTVKELESSAGSVSPGENEVLLPLDIHVEGIAKDNTIPVIITVEEVASPGLNKGNLALYHVENGKTVKMEEVDSLSNLTKHNQFHYDAATGTITLAMATFSEVAVVSDTENKWNGEVDTSWYNDTAVTLIISNADQLAGLGKLVSEGNTFAGNTVKLTVDVNFGGIENYNTNGREVLFYPIGYNKVGGTITDKGNWYTYGGSFKGVFDGTGHTVSGIYQNTWAMVGNYSGTYYNAAMGLFGYVNGGTVKNLTIDNFYSEGEFAPTGCVTAYAAGEAKFENIAITNSHPQTYNTGVAGIVGWDNGGDTEADASEFTFKNITIDDTNTISALWGSWDVAAAGLLGYLGKYSSANLENCNVSATIDVYNDVCGNYQYYWYRYCGMMIGTVDRTTKDGSLDLSNITATNCTAYFGDRHEYYYCEFEKNTQASYTEDYQFSRVDHEELNMDVNPVTCTHTHTANEDKQAVYIPFRQLFGGYGWGVDGVDLGEYDNIEISTVETSQVKFQTKFTNDDYLYRVGNQNTVFIGNLFAAKNGATINNSGVTVTIDKVNENTNVSGKFTASTTDSWTDGTIQFTGTGVVKVTIQDYNYCKPTVLYLEVVDAVNATSATSATNNNVVLLSDCGFSSLEVSGGYTLYGNGFTMTCGSDSAALDMGYSFVTLNNGTLDNVQIVCPNFDYAALYKSNLTSSENRSETTDKTRYYNAKSGVMASGNSQILNSRISGGRAAVNVSGGDVLIDNSRIEIGAVASVLVGTANSLTLRDVTLVQKPTTSTHDSSKTLMGFSVLCVCDAEGNAAPITIEGDLTQNAWVDESDKQYVPSAGQSIISTVLSKKEYLHDLDGDGTNESLNLGFAYMPESITSKVNATTITDNRTNKDNVPYDYAEVSILSGKTYVYSYKNTNGTADSFKTESEYVPNKYSDIITVNYFDTADGLTTGKSFGTDGWVYELNVDLDKLSGYALDFGKLSMSVNGVTVTDFKVNGSVKPTSPVAVVAGGTTYKLTATIDGKEYTTTYKVTGTETSKESPSLVAENYEAGLCVASSYGGTWSGAAPALEGIQIKYWSVAEKQYKTIKLSDYTPTTKGKLNGTNTIWTYSPDNSDFTLTLTGGQVHSGNSVYAMPVVCDGKLYFVAAKSSGLVNTGNSARTIPVSYSFKDNNNGDVLTFSHTWSVAENKDAQYNYSDFCNGTLTKLEASSSSCITPETLITLADGTQKQVQYLKEGEELLVWNLKTGTYDTAPIVFNECDTESEYEIIHLYFSDGSDVEVIYEHGFSDVNLGKYVYIRSDNAKDYIGHKFVKQGNISENTWETIELTNVVLEKRVTTPYSPVTFEHLCYYTDGVLSMPGGIEGLFNIFEVSTDTMVYDSKKMARDIENYGLFTYDDFKEIIPEYAYEAFNGKYLKVAIGKGYITWGDILRLAERYGKYWN